MKNNKKTETPFFTKQLSPSDYNLNRNLYHQINEEFQKNETNK